MTFKEHLRKEADFDDDTIRRVGEFDEKTAAYYRGHRNAMREILTSLSDFAPEVTLRKVAAFCWKRKRHERMDAPMCTGCKLWSTKDDCCLAGQPYWIPVDEVEKRMKEEQE